MSVLATVISPHAISPTPSSGLPSAWGHPHRRTNGPVGATLESATPSSPPVRTSSLLRTSRMMGPVLHQAPPWLRHMWQESRQCCLRRTQPDCRRRFAQSCWGGHRWDCCQSSRLVTQICCFGPASNQDSRLQHRSRLQRRLQRRLPRRSRLQSHRSQLQPHRRLRRHPLEIVRVAGSARAPLIAWNTPTFAAAAPFAETPAWLCRMCCAPASI